MTRIRIPPGTEALGKLGTDLASRDVRATQSFDFPDGDGGIAPRPPRGAGMPAGPAPIVRTSAEAPYTRSVLPPWREKLGPVSRDFNAQDFELTLAAGVGAEVQGPQFTLPNNSVGWLQQFQQYVLNQNATTSVEWILTINGGPVPGFQNKRNPPGVANLVLIDLNGLQVRIPAGATVGCIIRNLNANGPWTVGVGFAGWFHTLQAELDKWGPV